MTVELKWLIYTALLAGSLWIPFIVGVNTTDFPGKAQLFIRPPDHGQLKPWVHRSLRAHRNMLEPFVPFAIIVLVGAAIDDLRCRVYSHVGLCLAGVVQGCLRIARLSLHFRNTYPQLEVESSSAKGSRQRHAGGRAMGVVL
jgi:MAPEG family